MKIRNRQQWLMLIAAVGVVLLVADRAALTPLTRLWKTRAAKIIALRKQIEQGERLLQREQAIRHRWNQLRRATLPSDSSQAEQQLLRAFDGWARDARATITLVTPQWKRNDEYSTLECRVDASGNLETLCRFLYNVERSSMALKLDLVELTAHDEAGQQMSLGLQVSGLVLNTQSR
ncbi:MAG: hypothetical protein N3B01_11455 [Verrucomicrobiae bacterium]|nr:hypothetical protein [Verrucomicrobiae bacterium]